MSKSLILASESPRRKELLANLGFVFEVIGSPAEEVHDNELGLVELCELNASIKAQAVAALVDKEKVILAGDTLVYLDGIALGKPKNKENAVTMLKKLSGREHEVCTGMCLVNGKREERFHVITKVIFKDFDDNLIHDYMSKVNVMDKAGSYAVQEFKEMIIADILGDFTNVMGLPQKEVQRRLSAFGLQPEA